MDPTLQQLATDLSTAFDGLKSSQQALAPLQTAADAANASLAAGKQDVITATAAVDAKLTALVDYIHTGEFPSPTPTPIPPPTPDQPVAMAARRRL